ncbi:NADP-dependent oxidoreductase domain-containing protein [Aspergillus unguis]
MPAQLVFGGGSFMNEATYGGSEGRAEALTLMMSSGVNIIDTAHIYQDNEKILGELGAAKEFVIDTKYPGAFGPEPTTKEGILAIAEESLKKLQTTQVDVYYLHSPDRRVPLEVQADAVNTLYKDGKIKRFGVSNFLASEVEELVTLTKEKGWIVPSVYQGNYSAVARRQEKELFPTLRKHGIQFYAYSPIAGGFLSKDVETLTKNAEGRWDPSTYFGQLYHALYNRPSLMEGLKIWEGIAKEAGISRAELAYRWVVHNSGLKGEFGDKVIFGARTIEQLRETLEVTKKGPLPVDVVNKIDEIWSLVEKDAPLDNFNDLVAK